MSADNKKAPDEGAILDNGGAAVVTQNLITDFTPRQPIQKRRRLSPQAGALIKLDACEYRLHLANTVGDLRTWSRFYLSWMKLHELAFSYGRWSKGASDVK